MTVLGALIAGGDSVRFGSDKALAQWRGQSLIAGAIEALRECSDALLVCGRDWPDVACLPDKPEAGLGPLGGLNAALHFARTHGHSAVLCAPLDVVPLAPALRALKDRSDPAVIAGQRVIGLWPVSLADGLDAYLASGQRSVRGWVATSGASEVGSPVALYNINRPVDLDLL